MGTLHAGWRATMLLPSFPDEGLLEEILIQIVKFYLV
jgi:hypothetical protein